MAKYVHDDNNNRIEALSKEEIYALIDEVIETGELPSDVPAAFVTALKSIVDGKAYKIGFCTQAEYNQLEAQGQLVADALYIITDDETEQDLEAAIENLDSEINDLENRTTALENDRTYTHYIGWNFETADNYQGLVSFTIINHSSTPITPSNIAVTSFVACSGYIAKSLSLFCPISLLRLNNNSIDYINENNALVNTTITITTYYDNVY